MITAILTLLLSSAPPEVVYESDRPFEAVTMAASVLDAKDSLRVLETSFANLPQPKAGRRYRARIPVSAEKPTLVTVAVEVLVGSEVVDKRVYVFGWGRAVPTPEPTPSVPIAAPMGSAVSVKRGDAIEVRAVVGAAVVVMTAEALGSARAGERLEVRNPISKQTLSVVLREDGRAEVVR